MCFFLTERFLATQSINHDSERMGGVGGGGGGGGGGGLRFSTLKFVQKRTLVISHPVKNNP